ncbi:MAG: cation:proton antiporter, partial [Myxococcota bacterium]
MSDGHTPLDSPALTIAIAALGGVTAQIVGRHTGLPGIVLLLTAGVVLGPDVLNLVRPEQLGDALQTLVGFAVAVILFEGGLALDLGRLRRAQKPVRRLVTIGALVTLILGTGVAYLATGWPLRVCFLFGTLIIVTGPTVVTPLLRRLQVEPKTATVLEAEGVLIDAVGAVTAAVALEAALQPSTENAIGALVDLGSTLAFGLVAGLIAGGILSFMFQSRRAIPDGLENIFALVFVLALFQVTNAVFHESGVAAVTAAGVVLARTQLPVRQDLHHFKEQLTAMFIGLLFVLLAA